MYRHDLAPQCFHHCFEVVERSSGFGSQLAATFLSMASTLAVAGVTYLVSKSYEKGDSHYKEMVYLERIYNSYLNHLQTARRTIRSFREAAAKERHYILSFEKIPSRFEATMNLIDIGLIQEHFGLHVDTVRLNHDYAAIESWNDKIREDFIATKDVNYFKESLDDLSSNLLEVDNFLILMAKRTRRLLCLVRIKMFRWRLGYSVPLDTSNSKISSFIFLWNKIFHPPTPVTDDELASEMEKLKQEIEEITKKDRAEAQRAGLKQYDPLV